MKLYWSLGIFRMGHTPGSIITTVKQGNLLKGIDNKTITVAII